MPTSVPHGRHLRRSAGALLLLGSFAGGCAANADTSTVSTTPILVKAGTLTVCTDIPYEPFEFLKKGEPAGFDIELVAEVARRLDLEPSIKDTDFDAIQSGEALNSDACDVAISAMTITGDRARVLDFSSPYFNASQALVMEEGTAVDELSDLTGRKIGVQGGTTGELYVTDNAPDDARIVPFEDSAAMDAALSSHLV